MSDAFVQVQLDQNGKKVQTFENAVAGQTVEAQAVVLVDPTTGLAIATLPVSAVALPLPAGAAKDATLTGGTALTQITDGMGDLANVTKLGGLQTESASRERALFEDQQLVARDSLFTQCRGRSSEVRMGFTDRRGLSGQRGIR